MLLTTVEAGRHHVDLDATRSRLIESGTWKRQRIVIVLPSADMIHAKVALAIWNLIFPPNQSVFRFVALGCEVGRAYSQALTEILAHPELSGWEYLLTIEHDNVPPADGVLKLIAQMEAHPEFACIGGLYFTKGEGGVAQMWGDPSDPVVNFRPQVPRPGALMECCGTGMGFNLWRLSMFKDGKIEQPFFETQASTTGVGTQDLAFWGKARKHGYRCAIDCDVRVGHLDTSTGVIW